MRGRQPALCLLFGLRDAWPYSLSINQGVVIRVRSTEADRARAGRFEQEGALETEFELADIHHEEYGRTTVIPYVPDGGKPRP